MAAYRLIGARGGRFMHLIVNERNAAAHSLSALGLHQERILVPYRKGWSLPG